MGTAVEKTVCLIITAHAAPTYFVKQNDAMTVFARQNWQLVRHVTRTATVNPTLVWTMLVPPKKVTKPYPKGVPAQLMRPVRQDVVMTVHAWPRL